MIIYLLSQTNGEEEIANVDTGDKSVGLSVSTTHTGLKTIGTGTREHLVNAGNVVRVLSDAHVECVLSAVLDEEPANYLFGSSKNMITAFRVLEFKIKKNNC